MILQPIKAHVIAATCSGPLKLFKTSGCFSSSLPPLILGRPIAPNRSLSDPLPSGLCSAHAMMMSRNAFGRTLRRTLRHNCCPTSPRSCRGIVSSTSPGLQYETAEAAGVKIANREIGAPTTTIALVAKAGSRYQPFPGFSEALAQFAFKVRFGGTVLPQYLLAVYLYV